MNIIEGLFCDLVEGYSQRKGAISLTHDETKKEHNIAVELNILKIEFCYVKKASALLKPSTLYCRIYPGKNSFIYYHLPDIWHQLGKREFRCCYFPFIKNEDQMCECFATLEEILDNILPEFETSFLSGVLDKERLFDNYRWFFKLEGDDADFSDLATNEDKRNMFLRCQKYYNNFVVYRFTENPAYAAFLKGNLKFSVKIYEKWRSKDELLPYEKTLADFIMSNECEDFEPISEDCYGSGNNKDMTFGSLVDNFLVSFIMCGAVASAIFFLLDVIIARGTVVCFAAPWYCGIVVGGIPAIFGSIAFRRQLYRITAPKKLKEKLEIDEIAISKGVNIFAYIAFAVTTVFTLYAGVMMASSYVVFYNNDFKYDVGEYSVSYETRSYDDIDEVYYIQSRYNDYDERISRGSYVLMMKDGYALDLDGYTTPEECKEKLIPFLSEKGFTVKILDSDRDLP